MFRATLVAMGSIVLCGSAQAQTSVRQAMDVIEVRPQMLARDAENRRDQTRFAMSDAVGQVVAEMGQDESVVWEPTSANQRERLGGQDAAAMIYVQVFDGVFAIDPFEPLPTPAKLTQLWSQINEVTARQLMRGWSLETDTRMYGHKQVDRVKELFRALETARVGWLRENGYLGARTHGNPAQAVPQTKRTPEPAGYFRIPADMPRGKSREHVRISKPQFSAGQVADAIARADDEQGENEAVASRD